MNVFVLDSIVFEFQLYDVEHQYVMFFLSSLYRREFEENVMDHVRQFALFA